ncbi:hypothetical protein ACVWW2_001340 [Bradyrhizobium sp. LM4.3]
MPVAAVPPLLLDSTDPSVEFRGNAISRPRWTTPAPAPTFAFVKAPRSRSGWSWPALRPRRCAVLHAGPVHARHPGSDHLRGRAPRGSSVRRRHHAGAGGGVDHHGGRDLDRRAAPVRKTPDAGRRQRRHQGIAGSRQQEGESPLSARLHAGLRGAPDIPADRRCHPRARHGGADRRTIRRSRRRVPRQSA